LEFPEFVDLDFLHGRREQQPVDVAVTVSDERSFARVERAGPLPAGEVDLGDVVLQPRPLLAEGRVTDAEGRPVAGARVYVSWDNLPDNPIATTDDGTFVLQASLDSTAGPRSLVAIQGTRFSEAQTIEPGERDVQLVLSHTHTFGSFQGRVMLDPEIPPERIAISLGPVDFHAHLWDQEIDFQRAPDADGEFRFDKCIAGKNVLRVMLHHDGRFDGDDLVVLRDVVTEAGVQSSDPRCQPVDLRGKLHCFRLTMLAPDGAPAPYGKVLVAARRRSLPLSFWTDLDMPTHLVLTTQSYVDVDARVPGYRSVHLDDVSEDRTVQLEPGLPLRLVLPDDVELPPPNVTWSLQLIGDEDVELLPAPAEFAPGRRDLRIVAAEPGVFEVEWLRVEAVDGDRVRASAWGAIEGEPRQRIDILDVPGEQVFELLPLAPR